jgi:hypothetical protein
MNAELIELERDPDHILDREIYILRLSPVTESSVV